MWGIARTGPSRGLHVACLHHVDDGGFVCVLLTGTAYILFGTWRSLKSRIGACKIYISTWQSHASEHKLANVVVIMLACTEIPAVP